MYNCAHLLCFDNFLSKIRPRIPTTTTNVMAIMATTDLYSTHPVIYNVFIHVIFFRNFSFVLFSS